MTSEGDLYLLKATWQDETGVYRHRIMHTRANSAEEMFATLAKEHPEWSATNDYTEVGEIDGHYTSVTLFKTVSMDCDSWRTWVNKQKEKRREEIVVEERDRDMETIREIVQKWGPSALEVLALASQEQSDA